MPLCGGGERLLDPPGKDGQALVLPPWVGHDGDQLPLDKGD